MFYLLYLLYLESKEGEEDNSEDEFYRVTKKIQQMPHVLIVGGNVRGGGKKILHFRRLYVRVFVFMSHLFFTCVLRAEEDNMDDEDEQQPESNPDYYKTMFKVTCGALSANLYKKRFASGLLVDHVSYSAALMREIRLWSTV